MSDAMLVLDAITKTYNAGTPAEVQVLRGATLSVAAGEVVALVAPSGAGKSTLLHIAGLLDTPDAGHVRLAGRTMEGLSDRARTAARRGDVGFIYQFHHLLPEFSALENIVLPQLANGSARGMAEARAMDLLSRVGISARAGHRPAALSGGEQQRVALARAVVAEPRLILADEPIASLDPRNSKIVMDALRDVNRDGLTVLVNLHDLTTARNYCDRIVALNAGRVVFDGPPAELTATRIREVYGVTEEEFAEEAALAVGATPHQLAVA